MYMSEEVRGIYEQIQSEELRELNKKEEDDVEKAILQLIAKYNSCKLVLAEQEYQLQKHQLHYDEWMVDFKQQYMDEGYKSTEAKERAKIELKPQQEKIILIEKDIALIKADIHSIEYQLRLKYLQLKKEILLEGQDGM